MGESFADRTTTSDPAALVAEEVRGLLEEGREHGYLTNGHIAEAMRDAELSPEQLEELHTVFADLGIEVIEGEAAAADPDEGPAVTPEEDNESKLIATLDLSVKTPTSDSVRLYLKEMGKVPLLTAVEEVSLAKRIERGDERAKRQLIEYNLRLVV